MKILFLTLLDITDIDNQNIYTDLMRKFLEKGHQVTIISPVEKRNWKKQIKLNSGNSDILKVKIGNITKTNKIEKGISTLLIDQLYLNAIKRNLNKEEYDLVIYSTPPITFTKTIKYLKRNNNIVTYLLLKDIFPQNAVDLEMFNKNSFFYKFFKKKEEKLYLISDSIGCMSQQNIHFILNDNKEINLDDKVHLSPNTMNINTCEESKSSHEIKNKYNIPLNKKIFLYGGNIGKPQGIDFFLKCLESIEKQNLDAYFVVVGSGTEFDKLKKFFLEKKVNNLLLLEMLPTEKFNELLSCADVGIILLDYRFTIPNFPSRILSYMNAGIPILAATDRNTDVGRVISENGFGIWTPSNNQEEFIKKVNEFISMPEKQIDNMKRLSYEYLKNNYTSDHSYEIIINEYNGKRAKKNV